MLQADENPIFVDEDADPPKEFGATTVKYDIGGLTLWAAPPNEPWRMIAWQGADPQKHPDVSTDNVGTLAVALQPGQTHRLAVFEPEREPETEHWVEPPRGLVEELAIFAIRGPSQLIHESGTKAGGTWCRATISTAGIPVRAFAAASSDQPLLGVPLAMTRPDDGVFASSTALQSTHTLHLESLVPGNHYFASVMVVDEAGHWEVIHLNFDTLRRKVILEFPTLHIYNDGDESTHGAASFRIDVLSVGTGRTLLQNFRTGEMDIDDWSETDRPYPLGFAYVETQPKSVPLNRPYMEIRTSATEEDSPFGSDHAGSGIGGVGLFLPTGLGEELVNRKFTIDCPSTDGSEFHYGLDVKYTVEYQT